MGDMSGIFREQVKSYTVLFSGGGRITLTPESFDRFYSEEEQGTLLKSGRLLIETKFNEPGDL